MHVNMHACMHACMYACMYVYIPHTHTLVYVVYINMDIYTHMNIHTFCIRVYMCIYIYIHIPGVCVYICVCSCLYMCISRHVYFDCLAGSGTSDLEPEVGPGPRASSLLQSHVYCKTPPLAPDWVTAGGSSSKSLELGAASNKQGSLLQNYQRQYHNCFYTIKQDPN